MQKIPAIFIVLVLVFSLAICMPQRPRPGALFNQQRPGGLFNQPRPASPFGGQNAFGGGPQSPFVGRPSSGPAVGTGTGIANPSPGGVGVGLGIGAAVASPLGSFAIGNGQSVSTGK